MAQRGRKRTRVIPDQDNDIPAVPMVRKKRSQAPEREDGVAAAASDMASGLQSSDSTSRPINRRSSSASKRWDVNNPHNWNIAKLQEEIGKTGIVLPNGLQMKKPQLLQLYLGNVGLRTSNQDVNNTLEDAGRADNVIVPVDADVPTANMQTVSAVSGASTVNFDQEIRAGFGFPILGNLRSSPAATATVVGGSDVATASRPSSNGGLSLDPQDAISTIQTSILMLTETTKTMQQQIAALVTSNLNSQRASGDFNSSAGTTSVGVAAVTSGSAGTMANTFAGYTLESAFRQHAQGVAMEEVSRVEVVTPAIKANITKGKYVNLAQLFLPQTHNEKSVDSCSHGKSASDPRLSKTLTIGEFITAFSIYKNIMCEAYPQRRQELDTYERDIVDMATRFGGTNFYEYHKQFAMNAAALLEQRNIRINWAIRDNTLFCNLFAGHKVLSCTLCHSLSHTEKFCELHAADVASTSTTQDRYRQVDRRSDYLGRKRAFHQGREVCNNFNGRGGCFRNSCKFVHVCSACKGSHSVEKCDKVNSFPRSGPNSSGTDKNA